MARSLALLVMVLALACDDGPEASDQPAAAQEPSSAGAVRPHADPSPAPPVAPTPPAEPAPGEPGSGEAAPGAPAPGTGPAAAETAGDCLALCRRTAQCVQEQGRQPATPESECEASCQPGGSFANMPSVSWQCATRPDCPSFRRCTTHVVLDMALRKARGQPAPPGP